MVLKAAPLAILLAAPTAEAPTIPQNTNIEETLRTEDGFPLGTFPEEPLSIAN
jgi:hypothetical protein